MVIRYLGSKAFLSRCLDGLLPASTETLVSPFFGSGKAEYHLLRTRPSLRVEARDLFRTLVRLHQCLQTGELQEALRSSQGRAYSKAELRELWAEFKSAADQEPACADAARLLVLLHNSFNGQLGKVQPHAPMGERFFHRLDAATAAGQRLTIRAGDGLEQLRHYAREDQTPDQTPPPETVAYVDPPYYGHGDFRRYYHKTPDDVRAFHAELAAVLARLRIPWILSLNDVPEVRALYADHDCLVRSVGPRELLFLGPSRFWSSSSSSEPI